MGCAIGARAPLILIVDDHQDSREMIAAAVALGGYRTAMAASGAEALEAVARTPPALVLLDISMPGLDGFDVLSALRDEHGATRVPVVMLTAFQSGSVHEKAIRLGARAVLDKAKCDLDEVLAEIERHVVT